MNSNQGFVRFLSIAILFLASASASVVAENLSLSVRRQVVGGKENRPKYLSVDETQDWDPTGTAVIVCDMWDQHWCKGATQRVAEMALRMNEVLHSARDQGMLIIHCPSSCLDFYAGTPMRQIAIDAEEQGLSNPVFRPKMPLQGWCS